MISSKNPTIFSGGSVKILYVISVVTNGMVVAIARNVMQVSSGYILTGSD